MAAEFLPSAGDRPLDSRSQGISGRRFLALRGAVQVLLNDILFAHSNAKQLGRKGRHRLATLACRHTGGHRGTRADAHEVRIAGSLA